MGQSGSATRQNDIGDILHENMLGAGQFIGGKVMLPMSVDEQNGRFDKLAFSEISTIPVDDLAGDSSESNEIQHEYTTDTYETVERRLKEFTADRSNKKMDSFDVVLDDSKIVHYRLMVRWEKRIADIVFDAANEFASFKTAVTTPWSTSATATPVADIETAKQAIIDQMNGLAENIKLVGIGNRQARIDLVKSADIKDRWQGTGTKQSMANPSNDQLADALGLDEVWFSRLQLSGAQIWNKDQFGIYIVSDSPQMKSAPRVGNSFYWNENSPSMWNVDSWRWIDPDGTYTRVQTDSVEKLITARAGHLLTNVD